MERFKIKSTECLMVFLLFLFCSSVTACDRCVHQSTVTYFSSSSPLSVGACGYGTMAIGFNGGYVAAGSSALFRDGMGCGACFQIRCKSSTICSNKGVKVILTDQNKSNKTDFVLSSRAFTAMAKPGMIQKIKELSIVDIEYKRIPCEYRSQNLSVRVDESSRNPGYLAVKILYQGGQTDIVGMDVSPVGSSNWNYMTRIHGPLWETSRVPAGPLQFRFIVTSGYDGKWIWAQREVLPTNWKAGKMYTTGVQITDIAQEPCSNCDTDNWV